MKMIRPYRAAALPGKRAPAFSLGRIDSFLPRRLNRLPRTVLMLLGREARRVGRKRGVDRLVLACGRGVTP